MATEFDRVFKYPLPELEDWVCLRMPAGAEPPCVQVQGGTLVFHVFAELGLHKGAA